jgi:predicted RNA-binding Zn ribbon-like protein
MAGENKWPGRPSVQPGGRAPAPGSLALVQAFINTHYDLEIEHGAEVLSSPGALSAWLSARGLLEVTVFPSRSDLRHALGVREGLRALARVEDDDAEAGAAARERLNRAAPGAGVEVRFRAEGPRFDGARTAGTRGAIGVLLALTAQAMLDGTWARLKVCPGENCGWAFYDHSRNQAGRWCSMSVCGGRAKARTHYQRQRGDAL